MISLLRGKIAAKSTGSVIVDVGGVGYGVTVPLSTYYQLDEPGNDIELMIHTQLKENSLELFGFLTENEKSIFQCLIGISGIGPKGATNILSNITPEDLINSILTGDLASKKVPGIGPKTASRIINELKDKLPSQEFVNSIDIKPKLVDDIISVLINLGYTKSEIDENAEALKQISLNTVDMEDKIKEALLVMKK
jgi:Holliday junction DNA helicase RuvA